MAYPLTHQAGGVSTGTATLFYKTYTVQTNFQCSGITEYGATSVDLVDHIQLADGSTYAFSYEATPGVSGAVTGRLAQITLPAGVPSAGIITYSYSGGCNNSGINADGTPATLTRTTTDGTKTYARTISGTNAALSTTSVTDEKGNASTYSFTSSANNLWYETERKVYQGSASGTPLQDRITQYNGQTSPAQLTGSIASTDVYESFNGVSQSHTLNSFDTSGLLLGSTLMDPSNNNSVLIANTTVYNALGEATSSTTKDGGGNTVASSTYGYDETTPTATSNIPQHGSATGSRGNQTSSHISTGSGTIDTTTVYYDTGMPVSTTTPNGTMSFGYDATQTFATSTTLPTPSSGVALSTSATYDPTMGLPLTSTGMNNETTTVTQYDALLRPRNVGYPDGGTTTSNIYSSAGRGIIRSMTGNTNADTEVQFDGYGRLSRVAVANGQGSNPWYQTDYCYDAAGLPSFVSNAHQGSGWGVPKQCSVTGVATVYDALGRVTGTTTPDGTTTTQYFGRAVKTTDVNNVQKIAQYDIMGRMTGVCEISANGNMPGSGAPASCGMDIAGTGFLTTYGYNLSAHTTTVTQGAQTRTTVTDAAGRTTSTTEPERGTTTYAYAYNSTGLVVTRTRPQANQTGSATTTTTTQYDSLSRPVSIAYSDGTQTRAFTYDQAKAWGGGASLGYSKGRLTQHYVNAGSGQVFGYDAMGRVNYMETCRLSTCGSGSDVSGYTYDWAGNMTSASTSFSTFTYGRSLDGEVTSISSSYQNANAPATLISNVNNGPFGPVTYSYGNGLSQDYYYDALGRQSAGWVCPQTPSDGCSGNPYGYSIGIKGSQVPVTYDNFTGQNSRYTYDEFNRLTGTNYGNGAQTFSYTYDRYGNRWSQNAPQGGPAPSFSFNTANNRIVGMQYDAAGNLTSDGIHTYAYDAEGNQTNVDNYNTAQYVYDALNHRVWSHTAGNSSAEQPVYAEIEYDANGRRSSIWDGAARSLMQVEVYWDGTPFAFYKDGVIHFQHKDWTGSERMRTGATGAVEMTTANYPFGESISISGKDIDTAHFAQLDHDMESGNEDATYRKLSSRHGRWMSPDPYDGSYDAGNPQSFNRYAYVLNNPLAYKDPSGLYCEYADDADDGLLEPVDYNSSSGECGSTGGSWFADGWGSAGGDVGTIGAPGTDDLSSIPGIGGDLGAPNNGWNREHYCSVLSTTCKTPAQCAGAALKKNAVALSFDVAGVGAGFLPGGDLVVAGAQATLSVASGVNSAVHGDGIGSALGVLGLPATFTSYAAKAIGVGGKALPGVGAFVSGLGALNDAYGTYQDYQACLAGH